MPYTASTCQSQRDTRHAAGKRRAVPVAAAAAAAATAGSTNGAASSSAAPSAAETARTIVDLVAHGTLCTVGEDGIPLGTYVSYVLDEAGQPILRLRADAVHTANLKRDPKCSLFVQPGEYPARLLARVTLIGSVEPVSPGALRLGGAAPALALPSVCPAVHGLGQAGHAASQLPLPGLSPPARTVAAELAERAADLHSTLHAGGMGVDAPQPSDLYFRLALHRCFYVGQLSGGCAAEVLEGEAYRAAEADPLRTRAADLTRQMNAERPEDVLRIRCVCACARVRQGRRMCRAATNGIEWCMPCFFPRGTRALVGNTQLRRTRCQPCSALGPALFGPRSPPQLPRAGRAL
jgi:hypothetical protein